MMILHYLIIIHIFAPMDSRVHLIIQVKNMILDMAYFTLFLLRIIHFVNIYCLKFLNFLIKLYRYLKFIFQLKTNLIIINNLLFKQKN
jgi:hypothetical protein